MLAFFYASLLPCRKFTATSRAAPYSFLPVCAVFFCDQVTVCLPEFGIFTHTLINPREFFTEAAQTLLKSLRRKLTLRKNEDKKLPHQEVESVSALLMPFLSDALQTEPPHPLLLGACTAAGGLSLARSPTGGGPKDCEWRELPQVTFLS